MSNDFVQHLHSAGSFREGVIAERERIIKLLEDAGFMEYAIALIKGEQK